MRQADKKPVHRILLLCGTLLAVMVGLVSYSPTLYQMFCNLTGYGGTVQRAVASEAAASPAGEPITVYFDANVAPGLPWEFKPARRKVETRLGEPTRVNYIAHNMSDETVVARATFNVTPFKAAPYFFKIECFCFTEERLGPGESAEMPLVLYVDEQMGKDPDTQDVTQITLSYTFFRQAGLSPEEIDAARDLKAGSQELGDELSTGGVASFENDAPRQ